MTARGRFPISEEFRTLLAPFRTHWVQEGMLAPDLVTKQANMQTNTLDPLDSKHVRLRKAVALIAGGLFAAQWFHSAFATTPTAPRWLAADEQVVQDTLTRLEWTRADNG